jgi:hypothetical protein
MAIKKAAKTPDPAAELATKLVAALQAKKSQGEYPLALRRLAETADPAASPDVLQTAVGKSTFTKVAFLVKPPDKKKGLAVQQVMESPVGLWEDAELVARHPSTLAFVRAALSAGSIADCKKWVNGNKKGAFKKPFGEFLDAQFGPEAVAGRLLGVLRTQKRLGHAAYPLTLRRLAELTDRTPEVDVAAAVTKPTFSDAAVIAAPVPSKSKKANFAPQMNANVALREDVDLLAGSAEFLETTLGNCRSQTDRAFTIDEIIKAALGKWDKRLAKRFAELTQEKVASGRMPPTVGWISKKGKPLLFLLEDLSSRTVEADHVPEADRKRPTAEPPAPPVDASAAATVVDDRFAGRFEDAFRRLDRERGSNNFVWLTDLRRALAEYTHAQFDAGLRRLRDTRRFMLNAGEGHFGVSDEQEQSSVYEAGTIYLSVSRIES